MNDLNQDLQTKFYILNEDYVRLFKKYKKCVDFIYLISIDRLCLKEEIFNEAKKFLNEIGER